ncbi:ATP-binding protein [Methylonatrum kenyense]|uniref:ATP-binding protein n=1 Tax=Methylonatrum kenyense TaxID=455253 RepID=UPI0020BDFE7F|nr:ATP-binding protein [Methylonatrum kenyense]MCK8516513.1 ATP-binding protein [Methylonatrum kenyense]
MLNGRLLSGFMNSATLSQKLLLPMVILTILSAALTALIVVHQHRSFHALVEERTQDTVSSVKGRYRELRQEVVDIAGILAENPTVENGLLINEQFDVLNAISRFIGYTKSDLISVYDLDGYAFARGVRHSHFGDQDELSGLVRELIAGARRSREDDSQVGIIRYQDRPTLISARVVHGISGPAGVVIVGRELTEDVLAGLLVEERDVLALMAGDSTVASTLSDATSDNPVAAHTVKTVLAETQLNGKDPLNLNLFIDEQAAFAWFWKTPLGIIMVMATAALASVISTAFYVFHSVVRPVRHLTNVAERQVSGDLSAKTTLQTGDELGRLGQILNVLTANLQRILQQQRDMIEDREVANQALAKGQAQLRELIASVPYPVAITRKSDSEVLLSNVSFSSTLGLQGSANRRVYFDAYFKEKRELNELLDLVNQSGHVRNFEATLRLWKEEEIRVLFSMRSFEFQGQQAILNAFVDITERKKIEMEIRNLNLELEQRVERRTEQLQRELNERKRTQEELVRAKDQAERANASKSRFLTAASHDLRQPVHAMSLMAENLAHKVPPGHLSEDVEKIVLCLDSLREMFAKIFDIAKLDAGGIVPEVTDVPVSSVLERVASEYAAVASDLGLELRVAKSTAVIRSDPYLLYRILTNLVSNALENTREGGVLIGCRRRKDGVSMQVWDTGIGIREGEIKLLFKEFYRAKGNRNKEGATKLGPGIGLGLSIVEHVSNLLSHPVEVVSDRGRLTMFGVQLPYGNPAAVATREQADSAAIDVALENSTIFVVDDNPLALQAVTQTMKVWGCRVVAADSFEAAVRMLEDGTVNPDVCVFDYLLERGETGTHLIRVANGLIGRKLPAVILSGIYSQQMENEALVNGINVLHKPVQASQLYAAISESLRKPATARRTPEKIEAEHD